MGRLSAQAQMLILVGVIAVLVLAVTFLGILPLFQETADVKAQIVTEQDNLMSAQALLNRRQSAKAQSAASEVELMRIANQIPHAPQLPSVIIELQDVANQAGVELRAISPAEIVVATDVEGTQPQAFNSVPITLVVHGDWADLVDYLGRIAKLDRGVRTTSASFSYIEATDDDPAYVEAGISIEVYVMPEVGFGTEAPAPTPETP